MERKHTSNAPRVFPSILIALVLFAAIFFTISLFIPPYPQPIPVDTGYNYYAENPVPSTS